MKERGTYCYKCEVERIRQETIQFAIHEKEEGLIGWVVR